MKNNENQKKLNLWKLIFLPVVGLIILSIAFITFHPNTWVWYDKSPKPLGSKLEYIGKDDYGCRFGFCDSKPGSNYYYATDLNIDQIAPYFKHATLQEEPTAQSDSTTIWLHNNSLNKGFTIYYFGERKIDSATLSQLGLTQTTKHILKINASNYDMAKKSL